MSAIAFKFKCVICGAEFEAPEVSEMSYGEFVMRTRTSNEAVYLDATQDRAFLESYEIVKRHPLVGDQSQRAQGEIQQSVFSITCDKAADGAAFAIGLLPMCPSCGSREMKSWEPVIPIRNWPLPAVTHRSWEATSATEKDTAVDGAVRHLLTDN